MEYLMTYSRTRYEWLEIVITAPDLTAALNQGAATAKDSDNWKRGSIADAQHLTDIEPTEQEAACPTTG